MINKVPRLNKWSPIKMYRDLVQREIRAKIEAERLKIKKKMYENVLAIKHDVFCDHEEMLADLAQLEKEGADVSK